MNRLLAPMLLAVSGLLTGCPESVHPVSDPSEAVHDGALAGVWQGRFEDDEVYVHVAEAPHGLARVAAIWHKAKSGIEIERYTVFPSRVGEMGLLNVRPVDETGERGYIIFRYQTGARRLTLWLLSADAVRADIAAGKLKGHAGDGPLGPVRITATSSELQAYLRDADPERVFAKRLLFRRMATG